MISSGGRRRCKETTEVKTKIDQRAAIIQYWLILFYFVQIKKKKKHIQSNSTVKLITINYSQTDRGSTQNQVKKPIPTSLQTKEFWVASKVALADCPRNNLIIQVLSDKPRL